MLSTMSCWKPSKHHCNIRYPCLKSMYSHWSALVSAMKSARAANISNLCICESGFTWSRVWWTSHSCRGLYWWVVQGQCLPQCPGRAERTGNDDLAQCSCPSNQFQVRYFNQYQLLTLVRCGGLLACATWHCSSRPRAVWVHAPL